MSALADGRQEHRGSIRRLDAVFGGPIWWACHLGGSYWLIPRTCRWGTEWPLHVLTLILLALIARAFLSGLQVLRAGMMAVDDPSNRRDIFIGWVGIAFALFFGGLTFAEWLPALQLDPCW